MNKKVSLGVTVAVAVLAAAIAFTAAFLISKGVINSKLVDLSGKQAMFSRLSDVDSFVREHYDGDVDEEALNRALCRAYAEAYGGRVIVMTAEQYAQSEYKDATGVSVLTLSDSSVIIVLGADSE